MKNIGIAIAVGIGIWLLTRTRSNAAMPVIQDSRPAAPTIPAETPNVGTPAETVAAAESAFETVPAFAEQAMTMAGLAPELIGTSGYQAQDFRNLYVAEAQGQNQSNAWQAASDFIAAGNPGAAAVVLTQAGINPALIPASLR